MKVDGRRRSASEHSERVAVKRTASVDAQRTGDAVESTASATRATVVKQSIASVASPGTGPTPQHRASFVRFLPLVVFLGLSVMLGLGLREDPSRLPSPLIGKQVPSFTTPALEGRPPGLSSDDLVGKVSLVNVFASWCTACLQEHPLFMNLRGVVPIHGINYKDDQSDALSWLSRYGDPYARIGADREGLVGIDWGVYGVPETYVIDQAGIIRYKHIGPVLASDWRDTIWPLIQELTRDN